MLEIREFDEILSREFNEVIWDEDIKAITAFQELGIFIKGMVQVKTRYKSIALISAILMQVA